MTSTIKMAERELAQDCFNLCHQQLQHQFIGPITILSIKSLMIYLRRISEAAFMIRKFYIKNFILN